MKNRTLLRLIASAVVCVVALGYSNAATISGVTTTIIGNDDNNATGSANLTNGSASLTGATSTLALGDGTLEEFLFVSTSGINDSSPGTLTEADRLGIGISSVNYAASTLSGNANIFSPITLPNGTNSTETNTGARAADLTWTVDTSAYSSGTIYVAFATFVDLAQVVATTDGVNYTRSDIIGQSIGGADPGAPFDLSGTPINAGQRTLAVAAFSFTSGAGSSTITFEAANTDTDGSRARFNGIFVDAVPVPEPSSLALLGIAGLGLMRRRRA